MLTRFRLYGFLKNQRYYEPVFVLALLDRGLSFGSIGLLFGFRELVVALLEIPSGAAADVLGRRGSLVLAVVAYIASFVVFALPGPLWVLYAAMAFYALGESFRSGTHKAMIFRWLEIEGRAAERTRVYGITRSWSKYGSAVGVLLTGALLAATADYRLVFAATVVPYAALLVSLLTYPRDLEARRVDAGAGGSRGGVLARVARHTAETLAVSVRRPALRRLLGASMGYEGLFHAAKDYLQPVLAAIALGLLAGAAVPEASAVAAVLTPVYVGLFVMAGLASRFAHRFAAWCGGEAAAAGRLWVASGVSFAVVLVAPWPAAVAAGFVAMHVLQNVWRPILIARFDDAGEESRGATILSVESQARHLATMVLAPVVGFAVQAVSDGADEPRVWPIGLIGVVIALVALAGGALRRRRGGGSGAGGGQSAGTTV